MKYLIDFLQKPASKTQIYSLLKLNENETKILQFLTKNYIEGSPINSVFSILSTTFEESGYGFLIYLDDIKNLLNLGYITQNINMFSKSKQNTKLSLLHSEIELSEYFLSVLECGITKTTLPEITKYDDELKYLEDQFLLVNLYKKKLNSQSKDIRMKLDEKIEKLTNIITQRVNLTKTNLSVEQLFKKYSLSQEEKIIFLVLLKEEYSNEDEILRDSNTLVSMISKDEMHKLKNRTLLEENAKLMSLGLIDYDEILGATSINKSYFICEDVLYGIMHPQKNDKKTKKAMLENIVKESEIFELIEPNTDIDDVVLNPKIKVVLNSILKQLDKDVINKLSSWGIKTKKGVDAKIIFYGPAGTGKTMSALSLAKSLKKQVLSFDCSKILSKYVGESEQNVRKIFDTYKSICNEAKIEPVLLLNEADQFLSSRMESGTSSADKMHNQMQNIFLEQIERFEGVLIATTNFLQSLDSAFSRRFDFKIEFKKPNFNERLIIWQKIMPENANFEENFSLNELAKFELSGAQITLVLKNTALKVAVRDDDVFTLRDFIDEIKKEQISAFDSDKKVGLL
ncbi:ATP-binding protein [Campylobacter ureolyticus]|uniref:ATP-binding protein n=1 Tax=Campylobacter ureolyticus TaxID=827 RepID=A0A9Q4KLL0_9BACT|nr:ATP-binding protein [Campylobacter ureolyticus]MCZ6104359.1 ATP-binding protein [Campylobacter ureolyticus]MCZ6133658.1 ATP-binding protein [Campylobacter ureolyticus]MCZ6135645.1 ATP-binding protein [Campylobacter ureolyticus]MCZ6162361.1 ATP-binding protein [Campylobacter ureolyticus]MCZ6171404.1 ATP-binding protein [Campylobacter ureolyticus]